MKDRITIIGFSQSARMPTHQSHGKESANSLSNHGPARPWLDKWRPAKIDGYSDHNIFTVTIKSRNIKTTQDLMIKRDWTGYMKERLVEELNKYGWSIGYQTIDVNILVTALELNNIGMMNKLAPKKSC